MLNFIKITQIFGTLKLVKNFKIKLFWIAPLLLLSLDAHNHVDDYSGTLGNVCKTKQKLLKKQFLFYFNKKTTTVDGSVGGA